MLSGTPFDENQFSSLLLLLMCVAVLARHIAMAPAIVDKQQHIVIYSLSILMAIFQGDLGFNWS